MIKEAIRKLVENQDEVYSLVAVVDSVDTVSNTCDVSLVSGDAPLFEVRLQAARGLSSGLVVYPVVGSEVLVTFISKEDAYVAVYSEVENVVWTVEGQTLDFNKDGLGVRTSAVSLAKEIGALLDTMDALVDTLLQFQLATNVGPTVSVMPQVVAALQGHKVDFLGVKNGLAKVLK
jgi:hypothetical protein